MLKNGELFMIHQLREQGLSITAIALQTGLDRKTVRKYLQRGLQAPVYGAPHSWSCQSSGGAIGTRMGSVLSV